MRRPGTILSQMPRQIAASNMLCESATAVESAMTSRLNSDRSMPSCPCVTPSHIAGTPPANWATAPCFAAASFITAGYVSKGWCALSISLYAETMPMFGTALPDSAFFSMLLPAAIACARLLQDIEPRDGPLSASPRMRAR